MNGPARDLAETSLFSDIDPVEIKAIEAQCRWLVFDSGAMIVDRGDAPTDVYFLTGGLLKVVDCIENRDEIILAELHPGDCFGELSAIDFSVRSARVVAQEKSVVAAMDVDQFHRLLQSNPAISFKLLEHFAALIRKLSRRITSLSSLSQHQRIYHELLRLCEPNPAGDGTWLIRMLPKHDEIASWSGTSREDVAMAIGNLVREDVVGRHHKSLLIKNRDRLYNLVHQ